MGTSPSKHRLTSWYSSAPAPSWATFVGEVIESGAGAKQEVSGAGAKQEVVVEEKHVAKPDKGVDVRKFGLPPVSLLKYSGVKGKCADWWEQMRTTLQELGVPEENWRTFLRSSLSGNALAVFIRIEKQDKDVRAHGRAGCWVRYGYIA